MIMLFYKYIGISPTCVSANDGMRKNSIGLSGLSGLAIVSTSKSMSF